MPHVYLAEVDDGWSNHPYTIGASLELQPLKDFILEIYPEAVRDGDDYSFRNGNEMRISIEVLELLEAK